MKDLNVNFETGAHNVHDFTPNDIRLAQSFVHAFINVARLRVELNLKKLYNEKALDDLEIFEIGGQSVKETEARISFGYDCPEIVEEPLSFEKRSYVRL